MNSTKISRDQVIGLVILLGGIVLIVIFATIFSSSSWQNVVAATGNGEAATKSTEADSQDLIGDTSLSITNQLIFPIHIYIDGVYIGDIEGNSTKMVIQPRLPKNVTWDIAKPTIEGNQSIGDDMYGGFDPAINGRILSIDNDIAGQLFYVPVIINNTNHNCDITISDSTRQDKLANVIKPLQTTWLGYYKLFSSSVVKIKCSDSIVWEARPMSTDPASFGKAFAASGVLNLVINE